jgi:hypothetical protein
MGLFFSLLVGHDNYVRLISRLGAFGLWVQHLPSSVILLEVWSIYARRW